MKKFIIFALFNLCVWPAMAADDSISSADLMNYVGYGAIMAVLLLLVVTMLLLLRTFRVLSKILAPETEEGLTVAAATASEKPKATVVEKLLSLKPLSEEKSLLIEHDYDGIQELDNPTPAWFMVLFYATIVFAVGYLLVYHVFDLAPLQYEEYRVEMQMADKEKAAYLAKSADLVDENTVKLSTEPAVLDAGKAIYTQSCSPCHGDKAQGVVGPNLTDDYWLHGGNITSIFKTIKYGVQAKGMPNWEKQLSPKQIADVVSYIKSLHGSNPANAKEPQGDKEEESAGDKTAMVLNGKIK